MGPTFFADMALVIEILARTRTIYTQNVVVASAVWVMGAIVCMIALGILHKYVYKMILGAMLATGHLDFTVFVIGDSIVSALFWAVTLVAVIRCMVVNETGNDARRVGWAVLPRTLPLALAGIGPGVALIASGNSNAGIVLAFAGQFVFLMCAVDIAFEKSTFGIKRSVDALFGNAAATLPAVLIVGVVLVGVGMAVNSIPPMMMKDGISIWMLIVFPLVALANLANSIGWIAMAIAIHQHEYGSPQEHFRAEDEKLRENQNMSRMQRRLPSYMRQQGPQELPTAEPAPLQPNRPDPFQTTAETTQPTVAQSGVLYGGRVVAVVQPGATYGEWIGVSLGGELQLSISWNDALPMNVQVATSDGRWLPVRVATANPTTIPLHVNSGWHYLACAHGGHINESRTVTIDWYLRPNASQAVA